MRSGALVNLLTLTAAAALIASAVVPVPSHARLGREKAECPAERVFIETVTVLAKTGTDGDQIRADFISKLHPALQKAKIEIVHSRDNLGPHDVTLTVEIRAWTDSHPNGRVTLDLSSKLGIWDDGQRIWSGMANPGGTSRLLHFKQSDPKNLAKQTVDLFVDVCRAGWTTPE